MINGYCGPTEAAYYSVAYTLAMVLQVLNTSISSTMNPWIYRSIKSKNYGQIGRVSYCILVLIAGMNLLIVLAAPELLGILAPDSYQAAIWVVPPVTAGVYFMFLYNLFATFEYYYEKTHYVTGATIIGAVANVLLNAVFIPRHGFVAAGYTTLACYVLYSVAHYIFMRKVNRECMNGVKVYNSKTIFLLGTGLLVGAFLIMLLYKQPFIRYGIMLCLVMVAIIYKKALLKLISGLKNI